jgi:hypothetical protein
MPPARLLRLLVLVFSIGSSLATAPALASSTMTWPSVSGPLPNARLGKADVVLVAGVGRPFVLPPIPGATEVATDWYRFFVEGRGVPVEQAVLLRDADVTKETMLAEAARLRGLVKPGGTFWIVFVGHGAPALSGDDGLLLGVDVQPTVRSIEDRGLSQATLLSTAGAGRIPVVAVVDACFSGVRSDGSGQPLVPGAQATLPLRRPPPSSSTLTLLSASEQVAGPLPGHDRPAFSYLLLGAVRGWADDDGDGVVKVGEAFSYSKKMLGLAVRERSQVPSLVGRDDVVLFRGARERGPDPARLVAPPSSPPSSTTTRTVTTRDTFDRVAAEEAWKKRRVVATGDGFVRGAYATAVDEASILREGAPLAPDAAAVVRDVSDRAGFATTAGIGVGVAGVVGGGVGGALALGVMTNGEIGAAVVGGFLGGLLGITAGVLSWSALSPSEADLTRLSAARGDLAEAINTAERQRLGLEEGRHRSIDGG